MKNLYHPDRFIRAKFIFNPTSGAPGDSPDQLLDILTQLQAIRILPEVFLVEPGCDLAAVVRRALSSGIRLFIVSGGDGTIDVVAGALTGSPATLGIIPTGTQNNVAHSLGIPVDISTAVSLLRNGRRIKVDMGRVKQGETQRWFLEAASIGLLSALFPAADDIQHGNLVRLGDFLSTLVGFPEAALRLSLDDHPLEARGHIVLAANMPYIGPHFRVSPDIDVQDGLLDVLVFANLTKLDLIGFAVQMVGGAPEDPRVQHFHVQRLEVWTDPPMPLVVDGFNMGEGPLTIDIQPRVLAVIAGGPASPEPQPGPGFIFEPQSD